MPVKCLINTTKNQETATCECILAAWIQQQLFAADEYTVCVGSWCDFPCFVRLPLRIIPTHLPPD